MKNRVDIKIFLTLTFLFLPFFAQASTSDNIVGYAWSDTIGWISFNCTNNNTCAISNYGVNKNGDNTLTGYAWSDNIGWIKFGNLSGFPNGNGTQAQNANVNGNNLKGWAKAIGADGNGWDGWIALSGAGPSYNVTLSGSAFGGYAWGSDVLGWVSFDASGANGVRISGSATIDAQSEGQSIANSASVPYGTVATWVWTITNLPGATCSVSKTSSGGTSFATISNITSSGSTATQGLTNANYDFNITCTSGGNTVASSTVAFAVLPQPPGFSLGPDENLNIAFLPAGWSESETKTISVNAVGGFTGNVTVSISGYPTMPNASTTVLYSFNGGAYTANPGSIVLAHNGSFTFRAEVNRPLTASYCSGSQNPCAITLTGTSSGVTDATKKLIIAPTTFNPQFQEH